MPNSSDFYDNLRTIEGTFRSFKTPIDKGAKDLVTLAPLSVIQSRQVSEDTELYVNIINTLFPVSVGSCYPIEKLWKKINDLAMASANSSDEQKKIYKEKISKILRVYYYNGDPAASSDPTEIEIRDFYAGPKGARPSAYLAPSSFPKPAPGATSAGNPAPKLLRDMIGNRPGETLEKTAKLSMILIDTPIIDMKLRGSEKVDAFINYSPTMLISQCVPYVDAKFILKRKINPESNSRPLSTMGPLRFLLDATEQIADSTANALLYDSSNVESFSAKSSKRNVRKANDEKKAQAAGTSPAGSTQNVATNTDNPPTVTPVKTFDAQLISGMETFLLPQTLLNMDFDATVTRYNPIRNPSLPFGTIVGFTVNVAPAVGLMSFKTATLTLKIFDRSRLVEIADFINPRLYQSATLWMTYGWRGPKQDPRGFDNPYIKFINENMMVREAYGIRNTTIAIDDAGVATLTLSLFTKGTAELAEVTTDGIGQLYDSNQEKIERDMLELSEILSQLGIQSYNVGGADVRGSALINAVNNRTFPTLDLATYTKEFAALKTALQSRKTEQAQAAIKNIDALFKPVSQAKDAKPAAAAAAEKIAKEISTKRFSPLKLTSEHDLFAYFGSKYKSDADGMPGKNPVHRLAEIQQITGANQEVMVIDREWNGFGKTSFARVFVNYFQQLSTGINGLIDEFQVIFYRFNSKAGMVASMNIAEFPIDMALLQKSYTNKITEQKGERMSVINFLELVRDSQFNETAHRAYGLSKFFEFKEGKYVLRQAEKVQVEYQKAATENFGNVGSFMMPTIDFYIETAYDRSKPGDETSPDFQDLDLLSKFETAATIATSGRRMEDVKKIMRIHVYDKASTPHEAAATIMKQSTGTFSSVSTDAYKRVLDEAQKISAAALQRQAKANADLEREKKLSQQTAASKSPQVKKQRQEALGKAQAEAAAANRAAEKSLQKKLEAAARNNQDPGSATNRVLNEAGYENIEVNVFDFGTPPTFQKVKNKIAEFVPTILIGSNGTAVQNVSYTSNQDALLSTIMMLRSNKNDPDPAQPSGAGEGGLPLRVIPGQLTLTTLGCPLINYMQQFFVDLGTGTTIDNLYNVTGLTHNFAPGKFTSEIKFSFYDAYGSYESTKTFSQRFDTLVSQVKDEQSRNVRR